jgi:hypothetical protein
MWVATYVWLFGLLTPALFSKGREGGMQDTIVFELLDLRFLLVAATFSQGTSQSFSSLGGEGGRRPDEEAIVYSSCLF